MIWWALTGNSAVVTPRLFSVMSASLHAVVSCGFNTATVAANLVIYVSDEIREDS